MGDFGWLLFVVLGVLLFYFWTKVRGASFDELLERAHDEHVGVHEVLKKHPRGGTFKEFSRWMREKPKSQNS